jgi:acetyl-CoA/propionyl-CoA carboxylase biotin carboxyl carrier protein
MLRALGEYEIGGVTTLVGFHRALLSHECFVAGETCHGLVESEELAQAAKDMSEKALSHMTTETVAAASDGALAERAAVVEVDGRRVQVRVLRPEPAYRTLARRRRARGAAATAAGTETVVSPMQGTVLDVKVAEGDEIEAGAVICIVEAMKMENEVTAHRSGIVSELSVAAGEPISIGQRVCVISASGG